MLCSNEPSWLNIFQVFLEAVIADKFLEYLWVLTNTNYLSVEINAAEVFIKNTADNV